MDYNTGVHKEGGSNPLPPIGYAQGPGYAPGPGYAQVPGYPPGYPGGNYPPPISQQPVANPQTGAGWMPVPTEPPQNCPPGLEYLASIDQLLVHQQVELLEALTGFETENKYTIKNSLGQNVFYAMEQSGCCSRNCCGPIRAFGMKILDNYQNEVIHLERPLACGSCCFPCCLQKIEVYSPPGCLVGTVDQNWSLCIPTFSIKNAAGDTVMKIKGPCCTVSCCGDVEFNILSLDGQTVGRVTKQWTGLLKEMYTDADNFGISFPMDLDVKMKAVMLGACFLIDFMYFEQTQQRR